VSAHREENVDSDVNFAKLVTVLNTIAERFGLPINAIGVGDKAPHFSLPMAEGGMWSLGEHLAKGEYGSLVVVCVRSAATLGVGSTVSGSTCMSVSSVG